MLLTAVREVFEETSVRPVLGPRLPTAEYLVGDAAKRVDYWSARSYGSQAAASHEMDAVAWLPLPQAIRRLSYPRDAAVLAALQPRETVPLILLRHASAGQKHGWPAGDSSRPLDARGATDARMLARLLACFAPRARVLSSPALRCTESLRPYAAGFGGSVEAETVLALPRRSGDFPLAGTSGGDPLAALVRELVEAGRPAVLCLHRENLPRRWRRRVRRSVPRRPDSGIRRCPRAASGSCTFQGGRWPRWSATNSRELRCPQPGWCRCRRPPGWRRPRGCRQRPGCCRPRECRQRPGCCRPCWRRQRLGSSAAAGLAALAGTT